MTRREFRLPDLGEGLTEAEIVRWLVEPGQRVTMNQPLVEVETAKAVVELPCPFAGVLVSTHGVDGEQIEVGAVLVTVEVAGTDPGGTGPGAGGSVGLGTAGAAEAATPTGPGGPAGADSLATPPPEPVSTAGAAAHRVPTASTGPGARGTTGTDADGPWAPPAVPKVPAEPAVPAVPAEPEVPASRSAGRQPMLVGYGPRSARTTPGRTRRRRPGRRLVPPGAPTAPPGDGGRPARPDDQAPLGGAPGGEVVPGVPSAAAPDVPANGLANGLAQAGRTPSAAQVTTAGPAASGSGPGPGSGPGVPRALSTPRPARPDGVGRPVLAKPPVRKVARDLGVDLAMVTGSGPAGTITRLDVETAAAGTATPAATPAPAPAPAPAPVPTADGGRTTDGTPGAAAGGSTEDHPRPTGVAGQVGQVGLIPPGAVFDPATRTWRVAVSGVRRATARAMVASAFTAPQVTEFLAADLTATLAARDRLSARPEFAGVKVTPLLFTARALLVAIRRHPMINSSWVEAEHGDQRIVVHEAVNLGIAVASPRGLLVPNIPDAGRLGFAELAHALQNLASQARSGRSTPADLSGGTITITNVGVFGVDSGTPILNPGEAAILALGAVRPAPWVHEGNLAVRTVGQLSLSFDHRLVDGELGSAVLADVAAMLTDPTLLLAWS